MVCCVKLSGEDLSHYSNKIESVDLRKCLYYHYLTEKVISQKRTVCRVCQKNSWHRCVMKKLRHCRCMYEYKCCVVEGYHDSLTACLVVRVGGPGLLAHWGQSAIPSCLAVSCPGTGEHFLYYCCACILKVYVYQRGYWHCRATLKEAV